MASKWESFIFTCNSQLELPLQIPCNSVESDTGCTSRVYFDIVTLTLYDVTPTSQKPCKYNNKLDCSENNPQDAKNELFFQWNIAELNQHATELIFLTLVPVNKIKLVHTYSPGADFCTGLSFWLGTTYLPEKVWLQKCNPEVFCNTPRYVVQSNCGSSFAVGRHLWTYPTLSEA